MRHRDALSVLVLGMAMAIAGSVVVAIAPDQIGVRRGMLIGALLLMAAGFARAARQVSSWTRPVLLVVAALQLAWLVWVIARPFVGELDDWQYRALAAALWWSGIVLLSVAARAWWRPASPWVVIAATAALFLEALTWAPYLAPAFERLGEGQPELEPWIRPARELLTSLAIVVLVRASLTEQAAETVTGASG